VDEAQQMPADTLEELRLLTNLETPTQKLLQIVLSGQTELDNILARPSLRQLRQRITLRCRTLPLSSVQTAEYIAQRIRVAGAPVGSQIFQPEAIAIIHRYSSGIVRLINLLCEQALVCAFCDGANTVTAEYIEYSARELELSQDPRLHAGEPDIGLARTNANTGI
jgi:type II secretory pathway predicted ATPase ExeA